MVGKAMVWWGSKWTGWTACRIRKTPPRFGVCASAGRGCARSATLMKGALSAAAAPVFSRSRRVRVELDTDRSTINDLLVEALESPPVVSKGGHGPHWRKLRLAGTLRRGLTSRRTLRGSQRDWRVSRKIEPNFGTTPPDVKRIQRASARSTNR